MIYAAALITVIVALSYFYLHSEKQNEDLEEELLSVELQLMHARRELREAKEELRVLEAKLNV